MPRKLQVFGAIWAPLQLTEISRTVAEEYRRIVYKNIRSATGKLVSDSLIRLLNSREGLMQQIIVIIVTTVAVLERQQ
jgi:hypothetical protein